MYSIVKMSQGAMIAGAVGVMLCCSASSVAAVMMGGDDESNVGKVCTPQGTPDPNATYKYGANDACVMTCKTGYKKEDGACVEKTLGPTPSGPSCTLSRGDTVYECGDYVYQTRDNAEKQCGGTISDVQFIWDDTAQSGCGINRGDDIFRCSSYAYQKEDDARKQCGSVESTKFFIPAE